MHLQSAATPHLQHLQSEVHLESSRTSVVRPFFANIVNMLRPLAIFAEELHRRSLTGFKERHCPITYCSSNKVWREAFQHWGYARESPTPHASYFSRFTTQKQQDDILDWPRVLISLSNTGNENVSLDWPHLLISSSNTRNINQKVL